MLALANEIYFLGSDRLVINRLHQFSMANGFLVSHALLIYPSSKGWSNKLQKMRNQKNICHIALCVKRVIHAYKIKFIGVFSLLLFYFFLVKDKIKLQ